MRRRRRSSLRKEKAIMLTSSALVLTALTATGFYVRNLGETEEEQIVDFADLEEESVQEQVYDIYGTLKSSDYAAENEQADGVTAAGQTDGVTVAGDMADAGELDYDPSFTEVNSGNVENPGLTADGNVDGEADMAAGGAAGLASGDQSVDAAENTAGQDAASNSSTAAGQNAAVDSELTAGEADIEDGKQTAEAQLYEDEVSVAASADIFSDDEDTEAVSSLPALSFTESDALVWPIVGNVLVNYSMDKTVYFATLQQYKYSPAIVISATAGEGITAAADGKVTRIYTDPEIGTAVVMDLGDGYELTYGQLTDLTVSEGNYVSCGEIIGKVAEPTKYYSIEGTNVYFKLTKDGVPVNPLSKLG